MQARRDAERQQQNWTVEIFRQASLQSIQATHQRDALIQLQQIVKEVEVVIHEVQALVPLIRWIWDIIKHRPEVMAHLSAIEDKVRDKCRHHNRHGHFFELYKKNQEQSADLFLRALDDLMAIFSQPDGWFQDPLQALRRIHDAQDSVILTGLFLELISETVLQLQLVDHEEYRKLTTALSHLSKLGQKLHLKEERLKQVVESVRS